MKKRSKDMVPSIKLFEISHLHLEIHADLYATLYTQSRISCEADEAQTLTHKGLPGPGEEYHMFSRNLQM